MGEPGLRLEWIVRVEPVGLTKAQAMSFLKDLVAQIPNLQVPASLELVFTDDSEMTRLNGTFRGINQTTDVLSFPDGDIHPDTGEIMMGAIVVSVEQALRQAADIGHDPLEEICFLILHGFLHLLGMDHETDGGAMLAEQRRLKAALSRWFPSEGVR